MFMLLIMSRTELLREEEAAAAELVAAAEGAAGFLSSALLTAVTSPDFLSTPTMDHGRGLGSGLGLGTPDRGEGVSPPAAVAAAEGELELGFVDAGLELVVALLLLLEAIEDVNLVDLRPTMEPWWVPAMLPSLLALLPLSSEEDLLLPMLLTLVMSEVGEVSVPARPVDLYSGQGKRKRKRRGRR